MRRSKTARRSPLLNINQAIGLQDLHFAKGCGLLVSSLVFYQIKPPPGDSKINCFEDYCKRGSRCVFCSEYYLYKKEMHKSNF